MGGAWRDGERSGRGRGGRGGEEERKRRLEKKKGRKKKKKRQRTTVVFVHGERRAARGKEKGSAVARQAL